MKPVGIRILNVGILVAAVAGAAACSRPGGIKAASAADVERQCRGIPANARAQSTFEKAITVQPVEEAKLLGKIANRELVGVKAFIPAEPGLTSEYLQRWANCRVLQATAMGGDSRDPLAVPGVRPTISSTGEGFVLSVSAPTPEHVQEILRRAEETMERQRVRAQTDEAEMVGAGGG